VILENAGLMLADRCGAHLVHEPLDQRSARRGAAQGNCADLSHAAALRLQLHLDPGCGLEL
jgi:hypothetical protein